MALDETLLEIVAGFGLPILRFYGWTEPAATFGHLQKYSIVASTTVLRPLIRRPTGGGMVPHDADWTYSFVVPPDHEWYALPAVESYQRMHAWIQSAFTSLHVVTELAPVAQKPMISNEIRLAPGACFVGHEQFDLMWQGRKVAGAAQRRNRCGLLIQGSLQPPRQISRGDWQKAMIEVAQAQANVEWEQLSLHQQWLDRAGELASTKYSQESYNQKR